MNKWQMENGSISSWGKVGMAKDNHQKLQLSIHPGGRHQGRDNGNEGVSKPPRTREGIGNVPPHAGQGIGARISASAVYPGGKTLRRRMARLSQRQAAFARDYAPGGKGTKGTVGEGYMTKPGSMQ